MLLKGRLGGILKPSPVWAVFALALLLRLLWLVFVKPHVALVDDAGYYDFFALSIKDGHGYVRPDGSPTAFWPVGYPATLAALYGVFGHSLLAARVLNALFGALSAGLVYALARRWLGQAQAVAAGLVYACFPGAIGFVSLTLSESLFTLLFLASLYLVARASELEKDDIVWAVAFGVVAAAAAYVRGQALALPFFAAAWLLMAGWRWRRVVRYLGAAFAVVMVLAVPWLVRNAVVFGEPTSFSTNMGINLWMGHHAGADGGFDFQQQLGFAGFFSNLPLDQQELAWNREGFRQGVRYMLSHPVDEARLSVQKVIHLYGDDSDAIRWNEQNGGAPIFGAGTRHRLRLAFDGYYYAVFLLGFGGLIIGLTRRERWLGPVASALVLWTLVHVLFFGEPRLHVPVLPVFAILATVPLAELVRVMRAAPAATSTALEPGSPVP